MSTIAIILLVLAALIVLLAIGGSVANSRRRAAERAILQARAQEADQNLAQAHAEDKGWERAALEEAARRAYAERHGTEPSRLTLVQVIDRPGTQDDEALFDADGRPLRLGRRGDGWVAVDEGGQ